METKITIANLRAAVDALRGVSAQPKDGMIWINGEQYVAKEFDRKIREEQDANRK